MLDLKCLQLETQLSPCIGYFLTSFSSPWRGALSLFCSKAFTASKLKPDSSCVTFSIPSAACHGVVFLKTWLNPYLSLSAPFPLPTHCLRGCSWPPCKYCLLHEVPRTGGIRSFWHLPETGPGYGAVLNPSVGVGRLDVFPFSPPPCSLA